MSRVKKRFQFQKVLKEYNFMKQLLEYNQDIETFDETVLLLNTGKLNYEQCENIFYTLRHTLTLQTIILKGEGSHIIINEVTKANEAMKYKDGLIFYTKYVLKTLYQAITDYLYNSDRIKILAFKKIPITTDLPILCQGIRSNKSIRILHFEDCDVCDDGCIQICQALRKSPIESLGLENCKISVTGASWLAWLIREQSMLRTLTTWNKYQNKYEYKTEQGIRKIILNNNPAIKDSGAKFIVSTLFDDKWLTHIHLQNTGLNDITAYLILKLLKQNKSLTVIDITRNSIVSSHIMDRMEEALTESNHYNLKPRTVQRNTRNKIKNMKQSNINKLLSDKAQQTSEYSIYCEPFLIVDPNMQDKKLNTIYFAKKSDKMYDVIFQNQVYKESKLKPPVFPKLLHPMNDSNTESDLQSKSHSGNKKEMEIKNRIKLTRPAASVSINSFNKKNNRRNECVFQPIDVTADW